VSRALVRLEQATAAQRDPDGAGAEADRP
jgi:hypothetical protein